jgi:hypothetical protein
MILFVLVPLVFLISVPLCITIGRIVRMRDQRG